MRGARGVGRWMAVGLGVLAAGAPGQDVVVSKTTGAKSSLDLSAFRYGGGTAAAEFRRTLEGDLRRSGWFTFAQPGTYGVSGGCTPAGAALDVRCQVVHTVKSSTCLNRQYREAAQDAIRLGHRVADDIIAAAKGFRGMSSARLVLVGNRTGSKELYLADADGRNLRQLSNDRAVCMAPNWFPTDDRVVYTSFRRGFPDVYVADLRSRSVGTLANHPGVNMAGDVSPDGQELLLVLSKDGNPELYVKHLRSGALTRLTTTRHAGEASPSWSPDGSQIVYVSDSSGGPQLHLMNRSGRSERLTSRGSENVAPDWGPNGLIAYCSRREGRYGVHVIDPSSREDRPISPSDAQYEDPSWAPDGRHLACTRTEGYRSTIYLLDTLGDGPLCIVGEAGDWSSPAWTWR